MEGIIMDIIGTFIVTISSGLIGGYISYYFLEKSENYKFELLKREQAAKIAELFALWLKYNESELKILTQEQKKNILKS